MDVRTGHEKDEKESGRMKRPSILVAGAITFGAVMTAPAAHRQPAAAASKEAIVAVHYAPWFTGYNDYGWFQWVGKKRVHTAYTPLLGYYDNRTPATLSKHIDWATTHGIDAFMIEWCGMAGSGFPASMDWVVNRFPKNPDFKKIKFFFVYSFIAALRKDGEPTFPVIDLDDPERVDKLVSDFKYAAETYFNQPNQLRIDGRPVTYLWAIASSKGNFKAAVTKLRNAVKAVCGKDPFIVGEELFYGSTPNLVRTPCLDAVMPYMMIKGSKPIRFYKVEATIDDIVAQYKGARLVCDDLGVKFIPLAFAGFNPVGAPWCYDEDGKLATPVVARSVSGFKSFVQKAKAAIDPDLRMFYLTSWSEWNEGTNIEPAQEFGFSYLDVVKSELIRFTPIPLPKDTLKFAFKRLWNPPGPDERLLAVAFDKVEILDAADKVLLKVDIGAAAARAVMGIGFSGDETGWAGAANYCWAGDRYKFATLHLDLPADAAAVRFRVAQIPNQAVDLSLNGKALGTFPVETPMAWTTLRAALD
jgi:hypothetical protein